MSLPANKFHSIAIIGAGIIGLSCAVELAERGLRVSLYDKSWPPRGASWAAAGMLAPAFEAAPTPGTHSQLFELCDQSARLWPAWAAALEARTGFSAGYHPGPSLAVATSAEQAQKFAAVQRALDGVANAPEDCSDHYRDLEPSVARNMRAALLLPSDGQADNRKTMSALIKCVEAHPNIQIRAQEAPLEYVDGVLNHAGHDATLICAGWGTAMVEAIEHGKRFRLRDSEARLADIESVGGQMLSVMPIAGAPKMTVRSGHLYIVPKADRIIIGATTEPGRVTETTDDEIIATLKQKAALICPVLADAPIIESWAGIRPGTKDHAPILGQTRLPSVFVASGHYRNGILLAPITARIMTDLIVDGRMSPLAARFAPGANLATQV